MAGQLSDAQPMWVRFPQLRSCFSGAMEAQLFRNQQAVGSMSPFHSGRRRTDVHPDVVRPVGAVYLAPSTNWSGSHILSVKIRVQVLLG